MKRTFTVMTSCILLLLSLPSFASDIYKVTHVGKGTSLNLRAYPSPKSRIKVAVPHNASWIVKLGVSKKVGSAVWEKVKWNRALGWVNSQFLSLDPEASRMAKERKQCIANPKIKNKVCCGYSWRERKRPYQHIDILTVKGIQEGKTLPLRSQPGRWSGNLLIAIPHNATWIARLGKKTKLANGEVWELVRWSGQKGWINTAFTVLDQRMTQIGDHKRKLCAVK